MMKQYILSLLIPAYKVDYLSQVFDCIVKQTSKDFRLYVFDDASPYPIKSLYDNYFSDWNNASYFRFNDNIGRENLVSQWMRCVEYSGDEEWFWLFSDDDIMSENCVEEIHLALKNHADRIVDVMHFDICKIDAKNNVIKKMKPYPQNIDANSYNACLLSCELETRMPEYIFRRKKFEEIGGYVCFDLAWRSDNATVTAMTYPGTIYTISKGLVFWRQSHNNVTGINMHDDGIERKRLATIDYFNWSYHFFKNKRLSPGLSKRKLFEAYLMNLRCGWVYNAKLYDIIELISQYDAIETFNNKMYFIFIWLRMVTNMTKRRNRLFHLVFLLTHWK